MKSANSVKFSASGMSLGKPRITPLETAVLVLDDTNMLALAATVDPMRAANRRAGRPLFHWHFITATGRPARLTAGLDVPGPALASLDRADLVLVCASFRSTTQATPALCAGLRRLAQSGATMAGIDGGPWVLARAGLLDGHAATVHWEDLDNFAATHDRIDVRPDRSVISGPRLTASCAAPALEMMLDLITRHHGAALSREVANAFLYDPPPARPQSRHATAAVAPKVAAVVQTLAMMEETLADPLPIPDLAKRANLSSRRLEARFQAALRQSPQDTYLALRLTEAQRLAQDTDLPVALIASSTGFASQSSFARAFKLRFGTSVRALRRGEP